MVGVVDDARRQKLARMFIDDLDPERGFEFSNGVRTVRTDCERSVWEIHVGEDGRDLIAVSRFGSVVDLDRYIRQYEHRSERDAVDSQAVRCVQ